MSGRDNLYEWGVRAGINILMSQSQRDHISPCLWSLNCPIWRHPRHRPHYLSHRNISDPNTTTHLSEVKTFKYFFSFWLFEDLFVGHRQYLVMTLSCYHDWSLKTCCWTLNFSQSRRNIPCQFFLQLIPTIQLFVEIFKTEIMYLDILHTKFFLATRKRKKHVLILNKVKCLNLWSNPDLELGKNVYPMTRGLDNESLGNES